MTKKTFPKLFCLMKLVLYHSLAHRGQWKKKILTPPTGLFSSGGRPLKSFVSLKVFQNNKAVQINQREITEINSDFNSDFHFFLFLLWVTRRWDIFLEARQYLFQVNGSTLIQKYNQPVLNFDILYQNLGAGGVMVNKHKSTPTYFNQTLLATSSLNKQRRTFIYLR